MKAIVNVCRTTYHNIEVEIANDVLTLQFPRKREQLNMLARLACQKAAHMQLTNDGAGYQAGIQDVTITDEGV